MVEIKNIDYNKRFRVSLTTLTTLLLFEEYDFRSKLENILLIYFRFE